MVAAGHQVIAVSPLLVPLAGLLAAGLAWGGNRLAVHWLGPTAVANVVPLVEELAKTGLSLALAVPLLPVHAVFGALEASYDLAAGRGSFTGAALALGGHLVFGYLTLAALEASGLLAVGLAAGMGAHWLWNSLVMNLAS